jgi:D-3-phosphoglycerate dehydrogenase/C-terminal binding protein
MTDVVNSTIGMTLALLRGLLSYHDALRADVRRGWRWEGPPLVRRVRGQRFGVVGCGRIGTAVLMRARALGMEVGYHDPYLPVSHEMSLDLRRFPSLEALLGWADVVSLHTPLTEETAGMIDRTAVAAMKPGLVLVNCARGGLVDLDALADGLRSGRIAGAALDVLPEEPPALHPLLAAWAADEPWVRGRLCLTPHASWYSRETMEDLRRDAATTAHEYFTNGVLRNCVNAHLLRP